MSPEQFATDFVEHLLDAAEAGGLMTDAHSYFHEALYNAVGTHLGWFDASRRAGDHLRAMLPVVPAGMAVACLTPQRDSFGSGRGVRDVSCACAVRDARGVQAAAVGSFREGVVVSVGPEGGPVCAPRERGAVPHPDTYEPPAGMPAVSLPLGSAVVAVLRGRVKVASLVLTDWPASSAWGRGRPADMCSAVLLTMARGCGLAVRNEYGEGAWQGVAIGYLARSPQAIDAILQTRPTTRALPGEACPRCGGMLVDPDRGERFQTGNSSGAEADSWLVSGLRPTCERCATRFNSHGMRRIAAGGHTIGYERR